MVHSKKKKKKKKKNVKKKTKGMIELKYVINIVNQIYQDKS